MKENWNQLFSTAKAYHANGLAVLPIKANGTKSPAINRWKSRQAKRPTLRQLEREFINQDVGIAVCGGKASGELEILDLDDGEVADRFLADLESISPELFSELLIVQTPRDGGGKHLYYRANSARSCSKLALKPGDAGGSVTLIELKGAGGYVLAPGCPASCHPSGGTYEIVQGNFADIPKLTNAERELLYSLARTFHQVSDDDELDFDDERADSPLDPSRPGDDLESVSWQEILADHGWEVVGESNARIYWRRPGKDDGWSATTGNTSRNGRDLLCVFSTSTAFPGNGSLHSKFSSSKNDGLI